MDKDEEHSNVFTLRGEPVRNHPSADGLDKRDPRWFLNPQYRPCPEHDITIGDYCFRYRPEYEGYFIERGLAGISLLSISTELGIPFAVIKHWASKIRGLNVALQLSYQNSQFFWENLGRQHITDKSFNALGWLRMMAIQFPQSWRDDQPMPAEAKDTEIDPFGITQEKADSTAEQNAEVIMQRLLRLKKESETESA